MEMVKVNCHNVKCKTKYFNAVIDGSKKFEIRFDDRGYEEGDFIVLHECREDRTITGRSIQKRIGFVTDYEQKPVYCVFSLLEL